MNTKKAEDALREVARQNGVSEVEMRREIKAAIAKALESPDPTVQAYWKSFPCKGEYPTPEEVISDIARKTKNAPPVRIRVQNSSLS
jgi:hypothetical protein